MIKLSGDLKSNLFKISLNVDKVGINSYSRNVSNFKTNFEKRGSSIKVLEFGKAGSSLSKIRTGLDPSCPSVSSTNL